MEHLKCGLSWAVCLGDISVGEEGDGMGWDVGGHQDAVLGELPWWRSGEESACQCRGHGFEPWSGKIPHATEQLSSCATTTEPVL